MNEEWKDIKGYEGKYQVSNMGRVRSLPGKSRTKSYAGRVLSTFKNTNGYVYINLSRKTYAVHRLVADAFVENAECLSCINHKDEDKTNNNASNLEWCSYSYNSNYGTRNVRISQNGGRTIAQYSLNGELLKIWHSIAEAARHYGVKRTTICGCCAGRQRTSCGYVWRYCDKRQ